MKHSHTWCSTRQLPKLSSLNINNCLICKLTVHASVHILCYTNLVLKKNVKAEAQISLFKLSKRKYQYSLIEQSVGLLDLLTALLEYDDLTLQNN